MMGSDLTDFDLRVGAIVDQVLDIHRAPPAERARRLRARCALLDLIQCEVRDRVAAEGGRDIAVAGWLLAGLLFVVLLAVWPHLCS